MMQKLKKPISIVLSIMMVLSLFTIVPITASAETTGTVYDSGSVEVKDLQAGDYIVAGVGEVTDPSWTYDIVLKGGTYYDGSDVFTDDLTARGSDSYEILSENERIYFENWGDTCNYYPYVDGEEANAFYVESADHDAKTITLAGANYSAEEPEPTTAEPSTEATTVAPGETLTYNLNDENAYIHWDDNCSTEGHWSMYAETDDINFLLGSLNTPQAAGTYAWKDLDRTSCEIFIFEGENLKWYYFTDGSCTVAVDGNTVTINGTFTCQDGNTYVLNITTTQPEPTTAEPTTAEPTTAEPTTVEPTTEPAPADIYTVAGSSAAMFGTTWDATNTANDMTLGDGGVYSITYTDVQPEDAIQLKVVKNHSWDENWGDKETGDNYTFNVVEACDVTVTFDPATETVNVTGDGVTQDTELDVYSVIAVGNGEDGDPYLNGAGWDPCDPANAMTKVADGIWEFSMDDIYAFDNYNIKFAVNSVDAEGKPTSNPWAHNFGSEAEQLYPTGEALDAVYNGKNCIFEVEEDGSTVKFQLDLRNFDFKTKQGAKMTITVTAPTPPPAPVVVYADDLKPGDSVTSASKVFDTGDYTVVLKGSTYASFTPEFTTVQEDDKSFPPKTFIYKPEDGIIFDVPLNQGLDPYEAILDPGTFDRYVPVDAQGERTNVLYVIDKTDDTITLGGYNKPVDDVIAMINALPAPADVTIDTETALINARAGYDALTDAQKAMIDADTYQKLLDDEAAFAVIKEDIDAVYNVVTLIEELPTAANVELSDKENIEAARAAYDALTDHQKEIFPADKLQKLTDDEAAVAQIETDMAEAAIVDEMIKALPNPLNVSLNDKDDVAAASDAYNALTDAQKAYVPALSKIKLALVQAVVDAQEKYAADEAAADAVEEMIEALPDPADVTVADKEAIDAAGAAYNALTSTQKRMVLLADRIKLERVQNALTKAINDAEAAQKVIDQINALPAPEDVTVEDRADIREARIAYTLLTADQKALVDDETLQKLSDDEDVLADLLEVEAVTYMINSLPAPEDVTLNDKTRIEAARTWYDTLSDAQKAMIDEDTYKKLTDAEEALEALSGFTVTWMNGDEVLEVDANLPSGATPHYDGETPTKATDDKYVYEFMGWDPDLALVTADVTYNAVFDTYLIGDVNMDGSVDVFDAVEVQKYAAEKAVLNDLQLRIADVNKDGNVDILDASAIQRIAAS